MSCVDISFPQIIIYSKRNVTVIYHNKQRFKTTTTIFVHNFIVMNWGRAQGGGFSAGLPGIMQPWWLNCDCMVLGDWLLCLEVGAHC